jgi:L-rhamnose isomerase
MIVLQALSEPKNTNEIMNVNDFVKTETLSYKLESIMYYVKQLTLQVKMLHHFACVELTLETIEIEYGKPYIEYNRHLIGEKLTLKYL